MTNQDNERWRSFKKERPEPGHYQISLVPRDSHKGFCMYAYFNGRDWFDEHNSNRPNRQDVHACKNKPRHVTTAKYRFKENP